VFPLEAGRGAVFRKQGSARAGRPQVAPTDRGLRLPCVGDLRSSHRIAGSAFRVGIMETMADGYGSGGSRVKGAARRRPCPLLPSQSDEVRQPPKNYGGRRRPGKFVLDSCFLGRGDRRSPASTTGRRERAG
jgi:hypothetical protein